MLYFKMSYHMEMLRVRSAESRAPFGGCTQHVPAIQRKGENTMEEKNQPRRPRRSPEENTQKNESLVYGKNPVTELLKSGGLLYGAGQGGGCHGQAGASQQAAPDDRH